MDLLHLFAGGAIHNTRLMALHQLVQPLVLVLVRIASRNAEMQVFLANPRTIVTGSSSLKCSRISSRTRVVAVAVRAATCGRPIASIALPSFQ